MVTVRGERLTAFTFLIAGVASMGGFIFGWAAGAFAGKRDYLT